VLAIIAYYLAQQKRRYKIVKNRSRNTQKWLYFDLKIANFLQRLRVSPQTPITSGSCGFCPQTPDLRLSKLFKPWPLLLKFLRFATG